MAEQSLKKALMTKPLRTIRKRGNDSADKGPDENDARQNTVPFFPFRSDVVFPLRVGTVFCPPLQENAVAAVSRRSLISQRRISAAANRTDRGEGERRRRS